MSRRRRSSLLVCVLVLIGGASLWWWQSPDRPLVFVMEAADHPIDLMAMALDGSAQTLLVAGDQTVFDPAWSPDGQSLAFANNNDIVVIQADGTQRRQLTDSSATGLLFSEPSWSPDGTRIALVATERVADMQGPPAIYVMNVDGTALIRLTGGAASFTSPSWSPDGQHLVFIIADDEQHDIVIMQLADRHYQNITNTRNIDEYHSRWSPDGQWIVFAANAKDTRDIHVTIIQPNGTKRTQLTNTPAHDNDPGWSPDGSQIIFVSDRDFDPQTAAPSRSFVSSLICQWIPGLCNSGAQYGEHIYGSAVYTMNIDGSNVQRLTDSVGKKRQPTWRPARR